MKTTLTTLPSGLRIATCEIPHAETAAMAIWAGVGGRNEPAKLNGISHFIEHMLFKGTKRRTPRKIMEEVEGVEKELEERAEEINTLDGKRDAALAEFDAALANDKKEFESETKHRQTAFATLPARLASVYDRLAQRSRDGIAVAEVVNGSCSACFMSLRPQVQLNVKKGDEIITCESCTRILYMPKREAEASA